MEGSSQGFPGICLEGLKETTKDFRIVRSLELRFEARTSWIQRNANHLVINPLCELNISCYYQESGMTSNSGPFCLAMIMETRLLTVLFFCHFMVPVLTSHTHSIFYKVPRFWHPFGLYSRTCLGSLSPVTLSKWFVCVYVFYFVLIVFSGLSSYHFFMSKIHFHIPKLALYKISAVFPI
jgi:hypothetical protein